MQFRIYCNELKQIFRICVLKEFVIPPPLTSLTAEPVAKNDGESKYANREIKYTSAVSFFSIFG